MEVSGKWKGKGLIPILTWSKNKEAMTETEEILIKDLSGEEIPNLTLEGFKK